MYEMRLELVCLVTQTKVLRGQAAATSSDRGRLRVEAQRSTETRNIEHCVDGGRKGAVSGG